MPRGDKTGPAGAGAMTGRGMGLCSGNATPGYMNPPFGGNFGMGRGRFFNRGNRGCGRGWRNQYYATGLPGWARNYGYQVNTPYPTPTPPQIDELTLLKEQAQHMNTALDEIKKRITQLQQQNGKENLNQQKSEE